MKQDELNAILDKHTKWLRGEDGGNRADLRYADLHGAGLHYAAWEVLEIGGVYIGSHGHEAHYYLCRCKCGKTKTIKGGDLIKRTIRDCGCGAGVTAHV